MFRQAVSVTKVNAFKNHYLVHDDARISVMLLVGAYLGRGVASEGEFPAWNCKRYTGHMLITKRNFSLIYYFQLTLWNAFRIIIGPTHKIQTIKTAVDLYLYTGWHTENGRMLNICYIVVYFERFVGYIMKNIIS